MQYKLLCDKCQGKKVYKQYINAYNSGKCFKCNGHGYTLTINEQNAKESHTNYLSTIQRLTQAVEIKTEKQKELVLEMMELLNNNGSENDLMTLNREIKELDHNKNVVLKELEKAKEFYQNLTN